MLTEKTLQAVSQLSAALADAEREDDAQALAALVAACRLVEARALAGLAGRVTAAELLTAEVESVTALGW